MKQIREFMDQTEGVIAKDFLETQGIPGELRGSREYSSIVVGGTVGHYALLVPEDQAAQAHLLLRKAEVRPAADQERPTEIAEVALKKAVMFGFMAILIFPFIGNVISIMETLKYMRLERASTKKWVWIFAISWLQVPGIVVGLMLIRFFVASSEVLVF